jgi:hypothetical protein
MGYLVGGGYVPRRRVILDRDGIGNTLEGVSKLEEELCEFREVLNLDGMSRRVAAPGGGNPIREAICEKIWYKFSRVLGHRDG